MDAKEKLRIYLEQRRELGESELLLDSMSVEEALRAIGAMSKGAPNAAPKSAPAPRELGQSSTDDWRTALSSAGSAPSLQQSTPVAPPEANPPSGITVAGESDE